MSNVKLTYPASLPDDIDITKLAVSQEPTDDAPAVAAPGVVFNALFFPDYAYLATTSRISLGDIPNYTYVTSVTDGFQTISFNSRMEKLPPEGINNWGVPPYTEDQNKPDTLISGYNVNTMTWTLSRPSKVFGIELMPNLFGTYTYRVEYYSGLKLVGSITRTITVPGPPLGPSSQGARLFAAITDDTGFDRIVITSLSGSTLGFLVAQIRYLACVELCNVVIEDTKEKGTTAPVTCCVSVPGFEVASVSDDVTATILATCVDVQEDFICPGYGPVAGVKTATVKIFAELAIPVTLRAAAGGCPPITIQHTCLTPVVFTIENVFVSSEIKNARVISVSDVKGAEFHVVPFKPCAAQCCVAGFVTISAKVSACVMTNSVKVAKCS